MKPGKFRWEPRDSLMDYVPDRGDIVWLTFDPQAGREQAGRRPALVLSEANYNRKTNLALMCPITSKVKGYRFEVSLPDGLPVSGVILSDQVRSLDWKARSASLVCQASDDLIAEVLDKLSLLLAP
jgi:mRNA interferase MazF